MLMPWIWQSDMAGSLQNAAVAIPIRVLILKPEGQNGWSRSLDRFGLKYRIFVCGCYFAGDFHAFCIAKINYDCHVNEIVRGTGLSAKG